MKKFATLTFVFVLTAAMLAGCRSQNNGNSGESSPTILPTVEMPTMTTTEATEASTAPTTMPTEAPTEESTETVGENGVVGSDPTDTTAESQGAAQEGARRMPGVR
jgi:hypothetical protein